MSKLLNGLIEIQDESRAVLERGKLLVKKYEPTHLLEGLNSDVDKINMALLLENQAKQVIQESTKTGGSDAEAWAGVALPLVRRIFASIAAKEFVSVQPMIQPSGLVFYMDFKYSRGTTQPGFTPGTSVFGGSNNSTVNNVLFGRTDVATNGFYGAGRYMYSSNDSTSSLYLSGSSASSTGMTVQTATLFDADFNPEASASIAAGRVFKVALQLPSFSDVEAVSAFQISGSNIVSYFPQNTSYYVSGGNNYATFFVSASSAAVVASASVTYYKQPTKETRGDFEDSSYLFNYQQLDIPEIDLELRSESIVAKTKKLKAVWTPEMAQDLSAYHSVDAEAELTSILSEYISMEIDLEILDMLMQNALTEDYWSARIGFEFNSNTNAFEGPASNVGQFYTKQTWYQTLGVKINKISNKIFQKTLRGGANFMVVSPDVATILESVPGYTVDASGNNHDKELAMGVSKVGAFANRIAVYKNPYMIQNVALLGFKGSSFYETGAVYSPYIPLAITPLVYDPNNLTPRKGVITRYGKKVVRPEFYGRLIFEGLNLV